MEKTLSARVKAFMNPEGEGGRPSLTPSQMAALVAAHQSDLEPKERCKRQDIENLLQKEFRTVRYLVELAAAMGTTAENLRYGRSGPTKFGDGVSAEPERQVVNIGARRRESLADSLHTVGAAFRDAPQPSQEAAKDVLANLLKHYDVMATDLVPTLVKHLLGESAIQDDELTPKARGER